MIDVRAKPGPGARRKWREDRRCLSNGVYRVCTTKKHQAQRPRLLALRASRLTTIRDSAAVDIDFRLPVRYQPEAFAYLWKRADLVERPRYRLQVTTALSYCRAGEPEITLPICTDPAASRRMVSGWIRGDVSTACAGRTPERVVQAAYAFWRASCVYADWRGSWMLPVRLASCA